MRRVLLLVFLIAAGCEGPRGAQGPAGGTGPQGPEGDPATPPFVSITAGAGLSGGTITSSGTISIATNGVAAWMVEFPYAAGSQEGGAALDAERLGGLLPDAFAAASHTHTAADVTDFAAAAVTAMGAKAAGNPLHHDRYTDGDAVSAVEAGDLTLAGSISAQSGTMAAGLKVGNDTGACDAAAAGTIRYDGATSTFHGCNGVSWVALGVSPRTTYTRWGKTSCPGAASLVYAGYTAGSHYTHAGGGAEPICLVDVPTWASFNDANQNGALLYGAEFETSGFGIPALTGIHNYDVRCAVCEVARGAALMVPGTQTCPSGWTQEYAGYLMAQHYTHSRSAFLCVDENPDVTGSAASTEGLLFYPVEAECGALPCPPYVQDREVTCVVCTR